MDKNQAKITVKFGQAQAPQNALGKIISIPTKGTDPVLDKPASEEIISDWPDQGRAVEELAAGFETTSDEDSFGPKYSPIKRKVGRRKGMNKGKMIAIGGSVIGAITIGLVFGSIVLNIFKSGGQGSSGIANHVNSPQKTVEQKTNAAVLPQGVPNSLPENNEVTKNASNMKMSITLPASSYFVVQGGVFQAQGNASPLLDKIKSHGWPKIFVGDKTQLLLLGIAMNRDNALALAGQYKDFDVFIKEIKEDPITVSVPLKEGEKTSQEEWDQWAQKEVEFIKTMGQAIGQGLVSGKLNDDTFQLVTNVHRNLLQKGRDLVNKLPESSQDQGNRLLNDYTKVVTAMESYQKQPSEGYLWQAEQALLDSYISKKQLFFSFK
ncbi:MAG TPA: hypothetical protein VJ824_09710 [Bacillota bacterium]|nr:hypothetical protein [Bacillota bacterium]